MSRNHRKPVSRVFPTYHPRAGEQTLFVQKIWNAKCELHYNYRMLCDLNINSSPTLLSNFWNEIKSYSPPPVSDAKFHTIRKKGANPVKVGDTLTLFSWSGRPYHTPQIVIAPQIEVKQVWDFDLFKYGSQGTTLCINGVEKPKDLLIDIAMNDGLSLADLVLWFKYPKKPVMQHQIICWSDDIQY
jgi:hypothetical protein